MVSPVRTHAARGRVSGYAKPLNVKRDGAYSSQPITVSMSRLSFVLLVVLFSACAAPSPVVVVMPEAPENLGPEYSALVVVNGQLVDQTAGAAATGLLEDIRPGKVFPGGADGAVLFSVSTEDSTLLFLAKAGRPERLYGTVGDAVFTAEWSDDGQSSAFGHYVQRGNSSPGRPNMGAGDILYHDGQRLARVGCSASKAVLAWSGRDRLLVRNTDNLYVVERDGCATVATVDARRMHGVTVSPDAAHLAFVHRELEYNRATQAYVADSTFRLTDLDGGNPKTIVSFRYRPRNLSWKSDGAELAFDVRASADAGRAISIFNVASGTTAFLHPPAVGGPDEFAPVWSPQGGRIAYLRGNAGADSAVWVRTFEAAFPQAVPESEGARIDGWMDESTLIFTLPDGTARVHNLDSRTGAVLGASDAVIQVRRLR
ncbi:MAG: dipeptidyl aminopeptidase/acylaminoacyl peptidase [Rhodothermales bacterium]